MQTKSTKMVISKADAAERQLRTAIWLYFHDGDPVSIHGLTSAAWKVLWRLHEKHGTGHKTLREQMLDRIKPEHHKEVVEIFNETENFIKHGDRDPMAFHSFNPESTLWIMLDAANALQKLNGAYPIECQALLTWAMAQYPQIFIKDEEINVGLEASHRIVAGTKDKGEFYSLVYQALEVSRATAWAKTAPKGLPSRP
jgi:hypothetical protein